MSLKPKTSRRLALAGVLLVLAVGAIVALVFVRQWQKDRFAASLRADGMRLYEAHAYGDAWDKLRRYLQQGKKAQADIEAWRAYAQCLENDDQPEYRNLRIAIGAYERVVDLDPQDRASGAKLLSLYNRVGLFHEAQTLAARLRPSRIGDTPAEQFELLRGEAEARAGLKQFDDRFAEIVDRMLAIKPDDFMANLLRVGYLRENNRTPDAIAHAKKLLVAFPGNGAIKFLNAIVAAGSTPVTDASALRTTICESVGLDPQTAAVVSKTDLSDKDFLFRVVGFFDSDSMFAHSESLLRAAATAPTVDRDVLSVSIRRSWQMARHADVISRLGAADLSPGGTASELLAFKAMSLRDTGKAVEAKPIVEALKARSDYRAKGWSLVFEALPEFTGVEPATPVETVKKLQAAAKEMPGEPVISLLLGQAFWGVGRTDEAREAWNDASKAAPGWAAPDVELSRALLSQEQTEDAYRAAERALRKFPANVSVNVAFLTAQAAMLESGPQQTGNPREIAARLEEAAQQIDSMPDDRSKRSLLGAIIPSRVLLAARDGRADDARAIVRSAIAAPGEPDTLLMRRLAIISVREKLGVEQECLARAEAGTVPTPADTLTRAMILHETGRSQDGLKLLRTGREAADVKDKARWDLSVAQYLDAIGSPDAIAAWIALCDSSPDNLALQLAALRAPSLAADLKVVERLTERVNRLSSADDTRPLSVARPARARALLAGQPSNRARDEAVSTLRALTLGASDGYEIRSLLVQALLMDVPASGIHADLPGALEQLRAMLPMAPDKAVVSLQIGTLLHRQHEYERARVELERVAEDVSAKPELRLRAIDLLVAQADFEAAVGPLRSALATLGDRAEPAQWLKLAMVERALRHDSEAMAVYKRLADAPPDDGEMILQIADGLALGGARAQAEKLLARLDTLQLKPPQRDLLLATYWERRSDPARAAELYESAVASAPDNADAWVRYARFRIARSETEPAAELVKRGLTKNPGNSDLRVIEQQLALRRADGTEASLSPLVDALQADPANKPKAEMVRVVEEMRVAGRLNDPKGIEELRSKYPSEYSIQTLVIRLYMTSVPPRLDLAAAQAKNAMLAFPTAPEPASLATNVARQREDWPEMLRAAQAWQQLTRAPEAELAVAEAQINLDQGRQAIDTLRPHVEIAIQKPAAPSALLPLGLQARALVSTGKARDALALLKPLLAESADLRTRVVMPIAVTYVRPEAEAAMWLETVGPLVPESDTEGRVTLAGAWATLASTSQTQRDAYFERALAVVAPLTLKKGPDAAPGHEATANILQMRSDTTGAAEAYRRALNADPQRLRSMIGLGDLLIASNGDPGETLRLAEQAAAAGGPQNRACQSFLARAAHYQAIRYDRAGQAAPAQAAYKRAGEIFRSLTASDASDLGPVLGLAEVSDATGDYATSIAMYERVLSAKSLAPRDRAGIQNNLAYALLRSGKTGSPLDRARSLATEAVTTMEVGAFFDTLASIEAARGDRAAAVRAYSRAIELDPSMSGSKLELAALLANGGADERARAKTLLDELSAKPEGLSADQRTRLGSLRTPATQPK